jgi:hypothetical protein
VEHFYQWITDSCFIILDEYSSLEKTHLHTKLNLENRIRREYKFQKCSRVGNPKYQTPTKKKIKIQAKTLLQNLNKADLQFLSAIFPAKRQKHEMKNRKM